MSAPAAVITILLADAEVVAQVGTRVMDKRGQESTLPLITVKKISHPQDSLLDFAHPRIQVTSWGETPADAEETATLVRMALQRYKGAVGTVRITQITFMNEVELHDPETGYDTVPADYQVSYWEE